jgi:hypothetical protein
MTLRRAGALGATLLTVLWVVLSGPAPARAATDTRPIRPGVQMVTGDALCTGNFVFRDKAGRTYVGMAAHCAGKGSATDTDGCRTASLPAGTKVRFVVGLTRSSRGTVVGTGVLRYSSWLAMQKARTKDGAACSFNDLALVQVDKKYLGRVSAVVPGFGGPTGLAQLPDAGAAVYAVGSSPNRSSSTYKSGRVIDRSTWTMTVRTRPGGVPGDSGSGYLDASGRAVGVLSTFDIFPQTGANGVGSLAQEVAFARTHGVAGLKLVTGGKFDPGAAQPASGGGLLSGLLSILGV